MSDQVILPNSYASDWSAGLGADWFLEYPNASPTTEVIDGEDWLVFNKAVFDPITDWAGWAVMYPRFVLDTSEDFTIITPFRFTRTNMAQLASTLYAGEWNYAGIYFLNGAILYLNNPIGDITGYEYDDSTLIKIKIVYTAGDHTTKFYLSLTDEIYPANDGTYYLVHTYTLAWPPAVSLWTPIQPNNKLAAFEAKIGPIEIYRYNAGTSTPSTKLIVSGASEAMPWNSIHYDSSQWEGVTFQNYPDESTAAPPNNTAYVWKSGEGDPAPSGMMFAANASGVYATGSYNIISPKITLSEGYRLSTLRVNGWQGTGTATLYLLDSAQSVIGNGIAPNAGWTAANSATWAGANPSTPLSGISGTEFYLKLSETNGSSSGTPRIQSFIMDAVLDTAPPTTTADPPAGTYSEPQSVTLAANETATIYYTLDGTEPEIP